MDPRDRWKHFKDVVDKAFELPSWQRASFLDDACGDDRSFRERVSGHLGGGVPARQSRLTDRASPERGEPVLPGCKIGPYKIERTLGEGGMGAVYLASREDDFRRKVALKVIKPGMDSADIIGRFQKERQILAGLGHPNIGRLFDGGATPDGRPYFAMEYVEGLPIDSYCDRNLLSIRQRVGLFRKVCAAVSFAHQSLVIHRDIKPANILVTPEGEPKLLDFGISGVLDPETLAPNTITIHGDKRMTPRYASPEQIRGERLTAASDIYSLGVLLYELLSGCHPHGRSTRSPLEIQEAMFEREPTSPSRALGGGKTRSNERRTEKTSLLENCRVRGGAPEKVRRQLRGDLDNMVLKSLRREPRARYASVERFSEDLGRYLKGLPVEARPLTLTYRIGKVVSRHGGKLATAVAFVLLLAGFALNSVRQERQTARERDLAQRERDAAEQVTGFLADMFQVSNPGVSRGETITARELLDAGAARIRGELADQPAIRARLMAVIGRVYLSLGLFDKARPLLEEALAMRRRLFEGEGHSELADSLDALGSLHRKQGRYEVAEPLIREALALRRQHLGNAHPDIAKSMNHLALLLKSKGDFQTAEALFREALTLRRRLLGDDHPDVARSVNNLGFVHYAKGDYEAAEPLYREALTLRRRLLDETHPEVAQSLNNLARLLQRKGDYTGAEAVYRETLGLRRRLFGETHPHVAQSLNNLGFLLYTKGDLQAAEPLYRQALDLRRRLFGREHPDVAQSLTNLGALFSRRGDYREAEPLYREALAIRRHSLGEAHPEVAQSFSLLARLLADKGNPQEGERLAAQALTLFRRVYPKDHYWLAHAEAALGHCLALQRRFGEAERCLVRAFGSLSDRKKPHFLYKRQALQSLLHLYEAWEKPEQAAKYRALLSELEVGKTMSGKSAPKKRDRSGD